MEESIGQDPSIEEMQRMDNRLRFQVQERPYYNI